ncbi:MAG: hypothetical protein AB7F75_11845 [Planctomycetota bacterium]
MSLGIQLKGKAKERSAVTRWIKGSGPAEFSERVAEVVKGTDWRADVTKMGKMGAGVSLSLHPALEPLLLHASPDGTVRLSVRTTPSGPGYHLAAVSLIDTITKDAGVTWENLKDADKTGYLLHRDKTKLEQTITQWLHGFAKFVKDHPRQGCLSMDLPNGLTVEADSLLATSLGPRDKAWLDDILADPQSRVLDFFPWWNEARDVSHHQGLALVSAWCLLVHRRPETDAEEDVMRCFANNCLQAAKLDPAIDLPRSTWREVCGWLNSPVPPEAEGADPFGAIGYRRGLIHYPLPAGWSLRLPGDFAQDFVLAEGLWKAWDPSRRVEAKILPLAKPGPVEDILQRHGKPTEGRRLTLNKGGVYGVADWTIREGMGILEGEFLCRDSLMAFAVAAPDSTAEDWAVSVFESVSRR